MARAVLYISNMQSAGTMETTVGSSVKRLQFEKLIGQRYMAPGGQTSLVIVKTI